MKPWGLDQRSGGVVKCLRVDGWAGWGRRPGGVTKCLRAWSMSKGVAKGLGVWPNDAVIRLGVWPQGWVELRAVGVVKCLRVGLKD